jgi:peptide deformylase
LTNQEKHGANDRMAVLKIVNIPDPVLRRKAHKVTEFDKDFNKFVEDMIETMRDAPGVGLAAPQVGVSQRLIVVEYGDEDNEDAPKKLFVLANPEYISQSEEKELGIEACLSVPNLVGEVDRHFAVTIKAQNRRGTFVKVKAEGWLARIFQHEIDHLEGIIYTDRATNVWKPKEGEVYDAD